MRLYNCLIVEDEPLAAEVLQDYIMQVPFLRLKGTCISAFEAAEIISGGEIDLMFLDIHLPRLKGLDFLSTLHNPPAVIITTAYHDYAVLGYEYNVLDYLVKPIEFSRFLAAVKKIESGNSPGPVKYAATRKSLFFNVNKKKVRIFTDDILYIESLREYIRVVTSQKNIITKMPLVQVEEMLKQDKFIKVHRSFIVAIEKIDTYTAVEVEVSGVRIPVARNCKDTLFAQLGDKSQ